MNPAPSHNWLLHVWRPDDASRVLCGVRDFPASVSPEWARQANVHMLCPNCASVLDASGQE